MALLWLGATRKSWEGFRRQPEEQRGVQLARGIDAGSNTVIRPRLAAERRTQMSNRRRGAQTDGVGGGGEDAGRWWLEGVLFTHIFHGREDFFWPGRRGGLSLSREGLATSSRRSSYD